MVIFEVHAPDDLLGQGAGVAGEPGWRVGEYLDTNAVHACLVCELGRSSSAHVRQLDAVASRLLDAVAAGRSAEEFGPWTLMTAVPDLDAYTDPAMVGREQLSSTGESTSNEVDMNKSSCNAGLSL